MCLLYVFSSIVLSYTVEFRSLTPQYIGQFCVPEFQFEIRTPLIRTVSFAPRASWLEPSTDLCSACTLIAVKISLHHLIKYPSIWWITTHVTCDLITHDWLYTRVHTQKLFQQTASRKHSQTLMLRSLWAPCLAGRECWGRTSSLPMQRSSALRGSHLTSMPRKQSRCVVKYCDGF